MYTSIKTMAAAIVLPLVAALPLSQPAVFDSSKPFTLHTETVMTNASSAFSDLYLAAFHVGAAQNTVIASDNSSHAVGCTLSDSRLQQPIQITNTPPGFAYNLTLVNMAPYGSNSPSGYEYIALGATAEATTGFYFDGSTLAWSGSNSTNAPKYFDGCFALCHVNGTAPYFTLGPQYQLLWKNSSAASTSSNCADVKLVGTNIA